MKTIERYVFGAFLSSFLLAFLVLSFVLTIGLLVQIVTYIMDGVPMSLVGEFCMVSLPETLQWSVPLALLVSSVLVFSRMSADSEIAAMRACGIHLFQVIRWPVAFGALCTALGVFVNNEIVPRGHQIRRTLAMRVTVGAGLSALEPGRVVDEFPNVKLYVGAKEGNWVYDLVALDYTNPAVDRMITAEKALVTQEGVDIKLDLYQMTVDPLDEKHPTAAHFGRFAYTIRNVLRTDRYHKSMKDMGAPELLREIRARAHEAESATGGLHEKYSQKNFLVSQVSAMKVEFTKRIAFALASVCFVLIGIPLGIRSQRKESTVGMAISLAVSLGYYLVAILVMSLERHFVLHPEFLVFLPVVVCFVLSAHFLRKHL